VLSGNAVVIIVGAIGGTYLTKSLLEVSSTGLALFFATVGITASLVINYFILRTMLYPVDALQKMVEQIDRGDTNVRARVEEIHDPQLQRLAESLNRMLARLAAHVRMLESSRAQLKQLSGMVLSAQEDERKRIARELHDDTSGSLARVLLNVEMCEELVPSETPELCGRIRDTRLLCEQTLEGVRKIIFDLRPTLLDDLGLASAVHWYAQHTLEPAGIACQFDLVDNFGRLPPTLETTIFRIAQEAITNIVRHSNAKQVFIQLAREGSNLVFAVQDNGHGFDLKTFQNRSDSSPHWGLFGVRERVDMLNGDFRLESQVGEGTTLRVDIPLDS
jgi:two-component system sensor histidine kinase UhpB